MIVRLLLFAAAREAAGRSRDEFELAPGASLEQLLADAVERYGDPFAGVLGDGPGLGQRRRARGRAGATELRDDDEIAVLPPVSGGGRRPTPATFGPVVGPRREPGDARWLC